MRAHEVVVGVRLHGQAPRVTVTVMTGKVRG
jgi:hypothetical protein